MSAESGVEEKRERTNIAAAGATGAAVGSGTADAWDIVVSIEISC